METVNIAICGDFVPNNRTMSIIERGQHKELFEEVSKTLSEADFSIINLEAPIVEHSANPIKKAGPNLKTSPSIINSLKYLGIDAVTLANNHFYDYGEIGVGDTIKELDKNNIIHVGGGDTIDEAAKTLYVTINSKKIAIINCCEHEYSIASSSTGGSNPLEPIRQYYKIKEARLNAEYIIIIIHGGIEGYQLPTPRMKEIYRFFIDSGADAVVNHHQHCYSGYEIYNNKPIFYGLGNFSFDWVKKRDGIWNEGYIVLLKLNPNSQIDFELIPYTQGDKKPGIELMKDESRNTFFNRINDMNAIIANDNSLLENYQSFLQKTRRVQKTIISPYGNRYLRALCVRGLLPSFISNRSLRSLQNKVMCESHRERLLDFLQHKLE